jgi:lipopolysaccharide/colanic/teichoic acid biosynthesis glycosyltransferase
MLKLIFDKVASLIGLIVLMPVLIILWVLVKIKMPDGAPIFKQDRVGKNATIFTIYKFRTMSNEQYTSSISVSGQSRITKFGVILRKYKFDELPELWNVLIGDMSLVGPRPDVPGYADSLLGEDRKILLLRPGITGEASLKYANEEELLSRVEDPKEYNNQVIFPDKVRINLNYYYHHNLYGDIKIILQTLFRKQL